MSTSATTKIPQTLPSRKILDLPPELRNMIYELVLCHESVAPKVPPNLKSSRLPRARWLEPALLLVSRQVRGEARSIFWNKSTFTCEEQDDCQWLLSKLTEEELCWVDRVQVGSFPAKCTSISYGDFYLNKEWLKNMQHRLHYHALRAEAIVVPLPVYVERQVDDGWVNIVAEWKWQDLAEHENLEEDREIAFKV